MTTKQKELQSKQATLAELQQTVAAILKPYEDQIAPLRLKLHELEQAAEEAAYDTRKAIGKLNTEISQIEREVKEEAGKDVVKRLRSRLPADFREFAALVDAFGELHNTLWPIKAVYAQEIRAPEVDGLLICAMKEEYGDRNKAYAAWDIETGKLVGAMRIEGPRHRGDTADVKAFVDGKPLDIDRKPVETFVKALTALKGGAK